MGPDAAEQPQELGVLFLRQAADPPWLRPGRTVTRAWHEAIMALTHRGTGMLPAGGRTAPATPPGMQPCPED